ncbi:MAG: DUF1059 domain-containing protein, partial [Fulvivirga sp.]
SVYIFTEIKNPIIMEKIIQCRDVGFDCNGVIKARSEQEALQMAAEHAKQVHGVQTVTSEMLAKIRQVMKEK